MDPEFFMEACKSFSERLLCQWHCQNWRNSREGWERGMVWGMVPCPGPGQGRGGGGGPDWGTPPPGEQIDNLKILLSRRTLDTFPSSCALPRPLKTAFLKSYVSESFEFRFLWIHKATLKFLHEFRYFWWELEGQIGVTLQTKSKVVFEIKS